MGGAVIQWLRDEMRFIIQDSRDSEYYAQKVPDNGGVYMVPAFTGPGRALLGYVRPGCHCGHHPRHHAGTTSSGRPQESIAYQSADLMGAMEKDTGMHLIKTLKADGGASRDQFLMQFQADILDKVVQPPGHPGDHGSGRGLPGRPRHWCVEEPGGDHPPVELQPAL